MLSFNEFVTESKSAPLYHGTDINTIMKILRSGKIKASSNGRVSTTRSPTESGYTDEGYFVLDQLKLSYNRKITPTDWHMGGSLEDNADKMEVDHEMRRSESEESIKGDIPLKYVKELVINSKYKNLSPTITPQEQEWEDDIKRNPKLVNLVPQRYEDRIKEIQPFLKLMKKYPHIKLTAKLY